MMAQGKDPETADNLGGVHNVTVPRQPVPEIRCDQEPVVVGHGPDTGGARLVDDPEQIAKVVHTIEAPIEPRNDANARESTLRPMRTADAPFQDARIVPEEPSAWSAEKDPAE